MSWETFFTTSKTSLIQAFFGLMIQKNCDVNLLNSWNSLENLPIPEIKALCSNLCGRQTTWPKWMKFWHKKRQCILFKDVVNLWNDFKTLYTVFFFNFWEIFIKKPQQPSLSVPQYVSFSVKHEFWATSPH